MRRLLITVMAVALLSACNLKDPVGSRPANNQQNNTATNNTATNAGTDNQATNDQPNNAQADGGNNANNGADMGTPDQGDDPDAMTDTGPAPSLPSSAAVTGGSMTGESANYKVRLQVGAPHATTTPKSDGFEAEVAPPSRR